MRESLEKQILRCAQDDRDFVSNFGDRTLGGPGLQGLRKQRLRMEKIHPRAMKRATMRAAQKGARLPVAEA